MDSDVDIAQLRDRLMPPGTRIRNDVAVPTGAQFKKRFSSLFDNDVDKTVATYEDQTPRRQKEIVRRLERVEAFAEEFRSEAGSTASVSVYFFERGKQRTSQRLWVAASASPDGCDPREVDAAVDKAAAETKLKEDFHIVGWGGGCGEWPRQVDFWEGRG